MSDGLLPCPVGTIDGPSGAGKGTGSRQIARRLGFHFLDSGALYRLTALRAQRHGVALDDVQGLVEAALRMSVSFAVSGKVPAIHLDGEDLSAVIGTEQVGGMASRIAVIPEVREALLQRQRSFSKEPGLVADGRDMGSVVFPDADVKIFLIASASERAMRRVRQLKEKQINANFSKILSDIEARDQRDRNRAISPLVPAKGALVVDSTCMSIDQVVEAVLSECHAEGLEPIA